MVRHSSRLIISRGLLWHGKLPFRATNSCRVSQCLRDSCQIPQNRTLKQKCIPVGCVPPAQWPAVSRGCTPCMPPLCHACPPFATHAPRLCHACPPFTTHAPPLPCIPPLCHACPPFATHAPPPHMPPLGATTHAPPGATTHTPRETTHPPNPPPPKQPCTPPRSNHACPPLLTESQTPVKI